MLPEMQRGLYVIFEGGDGVGKTTTMHLVAEALRQALPLHFSGVEIIETHHPGSTPLGKHLRKIVLHPEEIGPDVVVRGLSRQMLYMVDTVAFVDEILEPALSDNKIVFADRSTFISGLVYGSADGVDINEISRMFGIITPPRADRLYILQCPWQIGRQRVVSGRAKLDHYDKKGDDYYKRIQDIYNDLITGPAERTITVSSYVALDDVHYIDTNVTQSLVVAKITTDLLRLISEREGVSIAKE